MMRNRFLPDFDHTNLYVVLGAMGLAVSTVLYAPAIAVSAVWFDHKRAPAAESQSARWTTTPSAGNGHVKAVFKFKVGEATTRFELVIAVLQTAALPLGYVAWGDWGILTVWGGFVARWR